MPSINQFLTEDHARLDKFLEEFQEWKPEDAGRAKKSLKAFASALGRHLHWEESILLPLFEQKTGQSGLVQTLLGEHAEIRERLEALAGKTEQDDSDSANEEKMLIEELGGHNAREEYAVYPELDRHLSDQERQQLIETLAAMPEEE